MKSNPSNALPDVSRPTVRVFLFSSYLLLQACSAFHYNIHSDLHSNPHPKVNGESPSVLNSGDECGIRFHVSRFNALSHADPDADLLADDVRQTREILERLGCKAEPVNLAKDANLRIEIHDRGIPDAPQDWLTGLSFGIIPSWKTAPQSVEYRFENTALYRQRVYPVDAVVYSHVLLFPISLAQLTAHYAGARILDAPKYGKALEHFLRRR